jgi:hypothetical protein
MPRKKSEQTFLFHRFSLKFCFQNAFDDYLSVTHVFIKQIFRAVELASSGSFQPQAVALVIAMKQ